MIEVELRAAWDFAGLSSGHAWATCSVCGEEAMLPRDGGRSCFLTWGCPGRMVPPADRPTPLQALKAGYIDLEDIRRHPPELGAKLRALLRADDELREADCFAGAEEGDSA